MNPFVLLSILALLTRPCSPACMMQPPNPAHPIDGCFHQGFLIPKSSFVTVWYPACHWCECDSRGNMQCCDLGGYPVGYPDDCEVIYFGCDRRAVKKKNHTIECISTGMVGR